MRTVWSLLIAAAGICGGGCTIGPKAIERSHGPYNDAVQRVDEEQLLKNIVRIRYMEAPRTLDIASIAAQYELTASVEARPFFLAPNPSGTIFNTFASILPAAILGGSNRPTVSMTPGQDATAVRQFLTPISAETLVFLGQAGWPVSNILRIWVDRMNGVPNFGGNGAPREIPVDSTRFQRICELMQTAQNLELLTIHAEEFPAVVGNAIPAAAMTATANVEAAKNGYQYESRDEGKAWVLVRKENRLVMRVNPAGRGRAEVAELLELLNLQPGAEKYDVVLAGGVADPLKNPEPPTSTMKVTPRSTAQAYFYLAGGVDVPATHLATGVVKPSDCGAATQGVFHVHSVKGHSHSPPPCAYVAIHYRDHWYYIDDRDHESKATLFLMSQLRQLDFKRQQIGGIPALTLNVGK